MGLSAVTSHMKSAKHKRRTAEQQEVASTQQPLNLVRLSVNKDTGTPPAATFAQGESDNVAAITAVAAVPETSSHASSASVVDTVLPSVNATKSISSFIYKDDVTKAEIIYMDTKICNVSLLLQLCI